MKACQRSTFAVAWILDRRGFQMFNYLNDFTSISPPNLATSYFNELGELLHHLGLEESMNKSCLLSAVMICLGVEINTLDFALSVSPHRLSEIEELLQEWLHKTYNYKIKRAPRAISLIQNVR